MDRTAMAVRPVPGPAFPMNDDTCLLPYQLTRDSDGSTVLELRGELTIEHVRALRDALCEGGVAPRHLEVHCGALTRLDAAAVQVLFAAGRSARTARLVDRVDAWNAAFARYGLRDPFAGTS